METERLPYRLRWTVVIKKSEAMFYKVVLSAVVGLLGILTAISLGVLIARFRTRFFPFLRAIFFVPVTLLIVFFTMPSLQTLMTGFIGYYVIVCCLTMTLVAELLPWWVERRKKSKHS